MKIETGGIVSKKTGSKFAVIIKIGSEIRSYVHEVKSDSTLNYVELLAVKFALLGSNVTPIIISTPNVYVCDILRHEGDNWLKLPKSNKELVDEIRKLIIEKNASITFERNEEIRKLCSS
jgi:ribonuclease HI